jgi:hypothetical protein
VKIYAESTGTDCSIIKFSERNKRRRPLALYGSQLQEQQGKV